VELSRVSGPECPHCGCADVEQMAPATGGWFGRTARYQCRHCGWRFAADAPPANEAQPVIYQPVRCPSCGHPDCPVTSTRRPVRHHQCRACGLRFKSYEHT